MVNKDRTNIDARALKGMTNRQLKKLLQAAVDRRDGAGIQSLLDAVTLTRDKGRGLFGGPPDGTLHYDDLSNALCDACFMGDVETTRILVEAGADIHFKNENPMRMAAYSQNLDLVRMLGDLGADADRAVDASDTRHVHETLKGYIQYRRFYDARGDAENGWSKMGEQCIAFTQTADNAPTLTTVFNFRSREVLRSVKTPGDLRAGAPLRESFDAFADKTLLREAEERLKAANGGKPVRFGV